VREGGGEGHEREEKDVRGRRKTREREEKDKREGGGQGHERGRRRRT